LIKTNAKIFDIYSRLHKLRSPSLGILDRLIKIISN
jgi:hypothetical protein